jgi:hypothetical protein
MELGHDIIGGILVGAGQPDGLDDDRLLSVHRHGRPLVFGTAGQIGDGMVAPAFAVLLVHREHEMDHGGLFVLGPGLDLVALLPQTLGGTRAPEIRAA